MKKFIIFNNRRCGSSKLGVILNSHPNITYVSEVFNNQSGDLNEILYSNSKFQKRLKQTTLMIGGGCCDQLQNINIDDCKIIVLTRKNELRSCISELMLGKGSELNLINGHLSPFVVKKKLLNRLTHRENYKNLIKNKEVLNLDFESLFLSETINTLFEFLKLSNLENYKYNTKGKSNISYSIIKNLNQIQEKFKSYGDILKEEY